MYESEAYPNTKLEALGDSLNGLVLGPPLNYSFFVILHMIYKTYPWKTSLTFMMNVKMETLICSLHVHLGV